MDEMNEKKKLVDFGYKNVRVVRQQRRCYMFQLGMHTQTEAR